MLDIELRMRELGWWMGEPIVLVSSDRVANFAFLSLFEHRAKLLPVDGMSLQYRSRNSLPCSDTTG